MINPNHSIIYEVDTIPWINYLKKKGYKINKLDSIPDEIFLELKGSGVEYLWLLGIYEESLVGKRLALEITDLHKKYDECLPGWNGSNIKSSPYAIKSYAINKELGGTKSLIALKNRLNNDFGIKLILDFVPNHLALDNPLKEQNPEYFVLGTKDLLNAAPNNFLVQEVNGKEYIFAHGRDPFFPAWTDTLQLDYRNSEVHEYMSDELFNLSKICDGVRCDMSMLILNEIFEQTWGHYPVNRLPNPQGREFWYHAISRVKKTNPEFLFIAEVYWGKEKELLDLGFDFVYDKYLYDCVAHRTCSEVKNYINDVFSNERSRIVFLENHDEERASVAFERSLHKTASVCFYTLPTMKLIYFGQMEGFRRRHAIQLNSLADEEIDDEIMGHYKKLFGAINASSIKDGHFKFLNPEPAWESSPSYKGFVTYLYENQRLEKDLIVINTTPYQAQCRVKIKSYDLLNKDFYLRDRLSGKEYLRSGNEMYREGLYLDLQPLETHIFSFVHAK